MFSISMSKKIVTNLRIDKADWLQIKAVAAELGMSVNEYINHLIVKSTIDRILALEDKQPTKKRLSVWDLPKLAKMSGEPMEYSQEDKIIYGLK